MRIVESSIIYENHLPQLCSRQSIFPFMCECKDGTLAAIHVLGEAFESVDGSSYVSRSTDGGRTWGTPIKMFEQNEFPYPITDYCKVVALEDGRLVALGYAYIRERPELPIGNPQTGGVIDDFVFYSISNDNGNSWGEIIPIECAWGSHVEASAPLTILKDGTWITPITGFPKWDGSMIGPMCY